MHNTDDLDLNRGDSGAFPSMAVAAGLLLVAGLIFGVAQNFQSSDTHLVLLAVAIGLGSVGAIAIIANLFQKSRTNRVVTAFETMSGVASEPGVLTDVSGSVVAVNTAFRNLSDVLVMDTLADCLAEKVDQAGSAIYMVARGALSGGPASRIMDTLSGDKIRLRAERVPDNMLVWRIENVEASTEGSARTLTHDSVIFGYLRVNADGKVSDANTRITELCEAVPASLADVLVDLPLRPGGVHHLIDEAATKMRVFAFPADAGSVELFLFPVDPSEIGETPDTFLDALPVALMRIAPEGQVMYSNTAAQTLMGIEIGPGLPLVNLVEGLGRSIPDWVSDVARGQTGKHSEVVRNRCAGHDKFVQIALSRLVSNGEVSVIAVVSDATEMKSLEAQFVQGQKMQAVGQLAGGVAHDFNNLLTAINGHCDLLLLRHETGDTDFGDLMQIRQNANRAASLVRQLLAFSRKQTLRPKVLHLGETLGELTHLLNRLLGERVTLSFDLGQGLRPVRVDERQFEQVIMNLVVNARDAMSCVGEVWIRTRNLVLETEQRHGRVVVPAGEYVLVEVTDSGVGIPEDVIDKIFEPFFTTKKQGEGTGLGLSTVYGIIKQTAGFIFADSVAGKGTTFSIYLPAFHDAVEDAVIDVPEAPLADLTGDGTILLVEDEAPVRSFAARALKLRGYTVLEADCGEKALEITSDPSTRIDLLISDVVMPGMDGPSWVREARKTRPDILVIFISGYAEDVFGADEDALKDAAFVPKPFSLSELTQKVKEVFAAAE